MAGRHWPWVNIPCCVKMDKGSRGGGTERGSGGWGEQILHDPVLYLVKRMLGSAVPLHSSILLPLSGLPELAICHFGKASIGAPSP